MSQHNLFDINIALETERIALYGGFGYAKTVCRRIMNLDLGFIQLRCMTQSRLNKSECHLGFGIYVIWGAKE